MSAICNLCLLFYHRHEPSQGIDDYLSDCTELYDLDFCLNCLFYVFWDLLSLLLTHFKMLLTWSQFERRTDLGWSRSAVQSWLRRYNVAPLSRLGALLRTQRIQTIIAKFPFITNCISSSLTGYLLTRFYRTFQIKSQSACASVCCFVFPVLHNSLL